MFRPMLAGKVDLTKVRFPVLVSPKLDGVRAIVLDGVVVSRNLKAIPNAHVQKLFSSYEGLDGELIVGNACDADVFRNTTSGVMSRDGEPDVWFHVFDHVTHPMSLFVERHKIVQTLTRHVSNIRLVDVPQHVCACMQSLLELEEKYLGMGYEGLMLRDQYAQYKYGRSTEREGWLLKLKRFEDSEATILSVEELLHNANESTINALGNTERSSHKENMIPAGRMGKLIVQDLVTGVQFGIGTGFDDAQRHEFWSNKEEYVGKVVKYQYFPTGSKDKPRFPSFIAMSNEGKE